MRTLQGETMFTLLTILPLLLPIIAIVIILIVLVFVIRTAQRMEHRAEERLKLDRENTQMQREQTKKMDELNHRLTGIELMLKEVE